MTFDTTSSATSKRSEKIPVRSGSSRESGSVYDRLYKTSTACSKNRKEVAPVQAKNILMRENENSVPTKQTNRKINGRPKHALKKPTMKSADGAVFNRLYSQGTASSRAALKPKNVE
eukprot:Nitzschia sp. Nitz4//scaffold150_size53981//9997//10347//NITZ4_006671-RA/size53981-processed-gene-0.15-mRNA-1//1//CDS//3329537053//3772//frame0